MKRRGSALNVAFLDLIFMSLLAITAILALVQINPESKVPPAIETRGKFLIVVEWQDNSKDDIDVYVRDPENHVLYFQSRDTGLMHLEYDDLGTREKDLATSAPDDMELVDRNEERVVLRGTTPGEYVVNIHMFSKKESTPTEVTIILYQLIGNDKELVRKHRVLRESGDEQTAFRFTVTDTELIRNINELPHLIVNRPVDRNGRPLR